MVILPCAIVNSETPGGVLQILRSLAIIPGVALILGFALARTDRRALFVALCVSAAVNVSAMFVTAVLFAVPTPPHPGPLRPWGGEGMSD